MPLFSKVFKNKDAAKKAVAPSTNGAAPAKPKWVDSWLRTRVDPEEVVDLLHGITRELKSRALDIPLLLLPFRPSSDPSKARTFVRNYFLPPDGRSKLQDEALLAELRMTEVMVLISVMKWCWARLPGGVVSWETYKMFQIGEKGSNYTRDAFTHFIPISVETNARVQIINDFFDLLASLAAHGKTNGLGGHKLSRYAGWWAFDHYDTGKGFEAGYQAWNSAADATSHLFFAFLRSQSPDAGTTNGILDLPRSLQQLVTSTTYPPSSSLLKNDATKVVMVVDVVSATPYALLRRAKHFEYRDDDKALQQFAEYDDPVQTLTEECRRVLRAISNTNDSNVSDAKTSTSLVDPSWSRFEDIGFSSALDDIGEDDTSIFSQSTFSTSALGVTNSTSRQPVMDLNRPTTPSWADFLSSGFVDENDKSAAPILLPPDKILPPIVPQIQVRGQSSQSHRKALETESTLEPAELASITKVAVDDAFWWVWISSLAGEEPTSRKAAFGRCAYVETAVSGGQWMILEEQVKGAAPEPVQGAYIAEKKGFFGFGSKKGRLARRRSGLKKTTLSPESASNKDSDPTNRSSVSADQQARINRAAQELSKKQAAHQSVTDLRRGRRDDQDPTKTNSVYTLGGLTKDEASPALQWAKQYDKNTVRAQYLGDALAGKGSSDHLLNGSSSAAEQASTLHSKSSREKDLPSVPLAAATGAPVHQEVTVPKETLAAPVSEKIAVTQPITQPAPPPKAEPAFKSSAAPTTPTFQTGGHLELMAPVELPASSPTTSRQLQPPSPVSQRNASPNGKPNAVKRLFGTMRKSKDESDPKAPAENPAVAAARRALEGKVNSQPDNAASQERVRDLQSSQSVKNRVAALSSSPPQTKAPSVRSTQTSPVPQRVQPVAVAAPVVPVEIPPQEQPVSAPKELAEPVQEPETVPAPASQLEAETDMAEPVPPRTRRDEEFDQLSRVDTNEREQADKEFSRFDQGSADEQAPEELKGIPENEDGEFNPDPDAERRAKHQSVYSAVTMPPDDSDEESIPESKQTSANDRWAQIRKNAADRAARTSEDQGNRSRTETRTDDGDTSGEETIESRVARIKARVAELTGNMDQTRR